MVERIIMDCFLRALPPKERKAVVMRSSQTHREMVEALKCALATLSFGRGEQRDNLLGLHGGQAPRWSEPKLQWERRLPESRPTYGTSRDEPMPVAFCTSGPNAEANPVIPWLCRALEPGP